MIEFVPPPAIERPPPSGSQIVWRALVPIAAIAAIICARAAAGEPVVAIEVAVALVAVYCAVVPDSHVGLLAVLLVGVNWVVATDDLTAVWSLGVAGAVAVLHTSMSAASVAPAAARWTPAMRRRWGRRAVASTLVAVPTWLLVLALDRVDIAGSAVVLAGALAAIGVGGLWVGRGRMGGGERARL